MIFLKFLFGMYILTSSRLSMKAMMILQFSITTDSFDLDLSHNLILALSFLNFA